MGSYAASNAREVSGILATLRDIAEDHERSVVTERFLQQLVATLPLAVSVVDPRTREVQSVNRAYVDLVGYELDEIVGARPPYPWWAGEWRPPAADWSGPSGRRFHGLFRRKDGRLVPVEIAPFTVPGPGGEPARVVALISDQSERHRFERRLREGSKLAAIGELAAGVAHEINNPLVAILGLVELVLRDMEPGTKAHDRLGLIQSTALEIKEIVAALLDFAREPTHERGPVCVHDVAAETVSLVRMTSGVRNVDIVEEYGADRSPVLAGSCRLKQIFLNLLTNAHQALPEGGTITVRVDRDGDEVVATVADTGEGIAADALAHVFDPFFTTRRELGGTGLGLAVSHGIAVEHGGRLEASSEPGAGATFTLRLPVHAEPA